MSNTLIFTFLAFFFDKKKTILLLQGASLLFYAIHLLLIWSIATGLFLSIQIGRNIFFAQKLSKNIHSVGLWFLILLFLYIYFLKGASDPLSWLTLIWSIVGTIACWVKNTTFVRLLFLASSIPWLYYVFQLDTIFPLLLQITFTTSNIINIVRFDVLRKWKK